MPLPVQQPWFGVVLECEDASALAHFYQRLLGWELFTDTEGWATLAPSRAAGYNLAFQRDEHFVRPTWPGEPGRQQMQMHLDVQVDDLDAGVAYARECGAEVAAYQPQETVRVLLDPAGHPFCLYLDEDDDGD
ncbi:MAG: VOC family protein [Nocardioidaceae bacterium]|nr:VOC family protein [Nocardioidaceae bacterium]